MHQFVQSAIEAAKQGDNQKALEFLKQVLNSNPNDIDAWLVLAAVVDDPQRKRQCLKRVLTLDPVNQVAQEELLEMDRAEMGHPPAFNFDSFKESASDLSEPTSASTPLYQFETSGYTSTSAFEPEPAAQPAKAKLHSVPSSGSAAKNQQEKKLVFKYPLIWRIVMYFFVVIFGCVGLLMMTQSVVTALFFLGFSALMLAAALAVSPTVEVSSSGIRASGIFSSTEAGWDEIVKMKSNAMKRRLELTKRNGKVVNVSTQVSGYPRIVEIMQKRRPDLFGMTPAPQTQTSAFSSSYEDRPFASPGSPNPALVTSSFKGTRTFRKNFFKQYGSYLIVLPIGLFAAYVAVTEPANRIGAGIALFFCLGMMILPLFQVSALKVEPGKLTVESVFEEKIFSAKEIREIKMQTVRGRYGHATNFVNIIPVSGKNYPLQGFSDGDEIIYGILTNWWNVHRNG